MAEWTEDRIEHLRKRWWEGASGAQIGIELGVSRGSVIGKAHRLKMERAPAPEERRPISARPHQHGGHANGHHVIAAAKAKAAAVAKAARAPIRADDPFRNEAGSVGLLDLAFHHCRWPFDIGVSPTRYCGRQRADELDPPYCAAHRQISFGDGTRGERRADDERDADRRAA